MPPVTIRFACVLSGVGVISVLSGVGVPTFVSGVLLQLQIADDRPGVGGKESATSDYNILGSTIHSVPGLNAPRSVIRVVFVNQNSILDGCTTPRGNLA